MLHGWYNYCIARKFGRELNLAVWRIDQATAKLKSANIILTARACNAIVHCEANWWVWSWGFNCLLVLERAVDDMSLYWFDVMSRAFSLAKQCTSSRHLPGYMSNRGVFSHTDIYCCQFLSPGIIVHRWMESRYWKHDALICNFPQLVQTPHCSLNPSLYISQAR